MAQIIDIGTWPGRPIKCMLCPSPANNRVMVKDGPVIVRVVVCARCTHMPPNVIMQGIHLQCNNDN